MIGFLSGKVKLKEKNCLIIDVFGVGYEVKVPQFTYDKCCLGQSQDFFIYTHVREDVLNLYGFTDRNDKSIFLELISVSGVGPKTALNILSASQGAIQIVRAIQNADVDFFNSIKGIGKKTSQRIIVDLKSKIGGLKELEFESEVNQDLVDALKGLGFVKEEIKKAVLGIDQNLPLEQKIRLALKKHGK